MANFVQKVYNKEHARDLGLNRESGVNIGFAMNGVMANELKRFVCKKIESNASASDTFYVRSTEKSVKVSFNDNPDTELAVRNSLVETLEAVRSKWGNDEGVVTGYCFNSLE